MNLIFYALNKIGAWGHGFFRRRRKEKADEGMYIVEIAYFCSCQTRSKYAYVTGQKKDTKIKKR